MNNHIFLIYLFCFAFVFWGAWNSHAKSRQLFKKWWIEYTHWHTGQLDLTLKTNWYFIWSRKDKNTIFLIEAIIRNDLKEIAACLTKRVNVNAEPITAVLVRTKNADILNLLCKRGLNINKKIKFGETLLSESCRIRNNETFIMNLLKNGALPDLKTKQGKAPIEVAEEMRFFENAAVIRSWIAQKELDSIVPDSAGTYSNITVL